MNNELERKFEIFSQYLSEGAVEDNVKPQLE
jgi:hypothetical protein